MAYTIRSTVVQMNESVNSSANCTATIAAGSFGDWAAGDVVVCPLVWITNTALTLPTGWTYRGSGGVNNQQHSSSSLTGSVCTYTLTSADISGGVSWSFTIPSSVSSFNGHLFAIGGLDTTTADGVDVCVDAASAPAATSFTGQTCTPTAGSRLIVEVASGRTSTGDSGSSFTAPTTDTGIGSSANNGGTGTRQMYTGSAYLTTSPVTANGTTSYGGSTWTANPNTNTISFAYSAVLAFKIASSATNATVTPGAVAGTATVGTVTVTAQSNATVTPSAVAATGSVPTASVVTSAAGARFVQQQGATSITTNGSNAAFDLNVGGAAPTNGNLLLFVAGNSKGTTVTWTPATGFTSELPALGDGTTSGSAQVVADYRIAATDAGAHYAWATAGNAAAITAAIFEYAGINGATPFDVAPVTDNTHATSLPGITTDSDGALLIYVAQISNTVAVTAPPTGFTTRINQLNGSETLYVADMTQASAGASGTVAPTLSGTPAHMVSALFALRPSNSTTSATVKPVVVAGSAAVGVPALTIDTTPAPSAVAGTATVGAVTIQGSPSQTSIVPAQDWTTSTTGSITLAKTPVQGNLLALAVCADTGISTPSGWTASASLVNVVGLYLFTKTAGAAESTTVTVTLPGNGVIAVAELAATNGLEALTGSVTRVSGSAPVSVALTGTTTQDNDYIVALAGSISPSMLQWDGWTGGFVEQVDQTTSNAGNRVALAVAVQTVRGIADWATAAQTFNRSDNSLTGSAAEALIVAVKADPNAATVRPGLVKTTTAVGAPVVVVSLDATATPTAVKAVAAVPQLVVVTPGRTVVPPATVSAVATIGSIASAVTSSTVSPDTVAASTQILPVLEAGATQLTTVTPAAVAASATVGTITISSTSAVDATPAPPAVVALTAVGVPTIGEGTAATAAPQTVTAITVIAIPGVEASDAAPAPLMVSATTTVHAPTILAVVPTFRFVPPVAPLLPNTTVHSDPMDGLMRHYAPGPVGMSVWFLKTGEITLNQPPYWEDVDHVLYGGHEYTVSADEAARLRAAGFEVEAAV